MRPIKTFVSERRTANLLRQIRWRDGVYCLCCRSESQIRHGSYRVFQRYLCKDRDRTFNDQTGTVFEHSVVALRKWFLVVYTYIRFNTSLRQLDVEIDVSCKTIYRRVQLNGPVEVDGFYVKAGLKHRERDRRDGGSCRLEESPKIGSHRISERFSSAVKYSENREKKHSKPSSKLRYD